MITKNGDNLNLYDIFLIIVIIIFYIFIVDISIYIWYKFVKYHY